MPSLYQDPASPVYRIRFRYQGRQVNRSLRTKNKRVAKATCEQVGEMLDLVGRGLTTIPINADAVSFLLSGGRTRQSVGSAKVLGLTKFFQLYEERLPKGAKEATTLDGEKLHVRHFKRHLGPNRSVQSITKADLQKFVTKRLEETHRSKPIQPETVRKELVTFRMLWNWGVEEGLLIGRSPTKHVTLPLVDEKPPFMTRSEIKAIAKRGGRSEEEQSIFWKSLFLEKEEIAAVLEHAKRNASSPFVYPMLVFVAHTGARRSEMVRALIEDIDFRARTMLIREKKKSRTKAMTYRRIDMSPLLEQVMRDWVENHPGGHSIFCQRRSTTEVEPLTVWQASHHLKQTLRKSEWAIVRGFHVFRHSFASNLALAGVSDKVIDEWMGHQTEEMRQRYRHLFPRQRRSAIEAAFG